MSAAPAPAPGRAGPQCQPGNTSRVTWETDAVHRGSYVDRGQPISADSKWGAAGTARYQEGTGGAGCFSVENQNGAAGSLPANAGTTGWDVEESLDIDMVSAT